jgi:hypothetical protein
MSRVKYSNKVFRLKKAMEVNLKGVPQTLQFTLGEEFHIVADVLYMKGFRAMFQKPIIDWIEANPNLFVDDTRNF